MRLPRVMLLLRVMVSERVVVPRVAESSMALGMAGLVDQLVAVSQVLLVGEIQVALVAKAVGVARAAQRVSARAVVRRFISFSRKQDVNSR